MLTNKWKKISIITVICLLVQIVLYLPLSSEVLAADANVTAALEKAADYCNDNIVKFTDSEADWAMLGIAWAGSADKCILLDQNPASALEYSRVLMGSIARGCDSDTINSYITALEGMQTVNGEVYGHFNTDNNNSLNQTVWSVIALNFAAANNYAVTYDQDAALDYISKQQADNGGFDEWGWGYIDADSTAHALIALAADKNRHTEVINKALEYLKTQQSDSGGFMNFGSENSDSTAAVIEAIIALGENPQSPSGEGWKGNIVNALLSYQSEEGWFVNSWESSDWNDPSKPNLMSTRNALLALGDLSQNKSKYQNQLPEKQDLFMEIDSAAGFSLDSDASINVQLSNSGVADASVLVITGLFNLENEKMLTYTSLSNTLQAGETAVLGSGFTIPETGDYEVRVMVWDNWNNKTPIVSKTIISVQ